MKIGSKGNDLASKRKNSLFSEIRVKRSLWMKINFYMEGVRQRRQTIKNLSKDS